MNIKFERQLAPYIHTFNSLDLPQQAVDIVGSSILTEQQEEILTLAKTTWIKYSRSTQGLAFQTSLKTSDLTTAQKSVNRLAVGPLFDTVKEKIAAADPFGIVPLSFSIGFNFQAKFLLGVSATIGVAIGIGNEKDVAIAEFITIGMEEGIHKKLEVGMQFGLWSHTPANLGGHSTSTAVTPSNSAIKGAASMVYDLSSELIGVTTEIIYGTGNRVAEGRAWTFVLGEQQGRDNPGRGFYLQPAYQRSIGKPNFLIIESLQCINQKEVGNDEVYFRFSADDGYGYFYPTYDYYGMDSKEKHAYNIWNCGRSVWFNKTVEVTLYNDDFGNHQKADFMVSRIFHLEELAAIGQSRTFRMQNDSGAGDIIYDITIKLVESRERRSTS